MTRDTSDRTAVTPDPVFGLVAATPARLALGRAGAGMPTRAVLEFAAAHAQARDAVLAALDVALLEQSLAGLGVETLLLDSAAPDRATYLRRPDFGRRLSRASRTLLAARPPGSCDLVFVVADGLSAHAAEQNAAPLLTLLLPRLHRWTVGPLVMVRQARVAIADEIGAMLDARLTVMLIGERPGLSSADSLGAYLTFGPRVGRTDAERNCVSNIRAAGLRPDQAALTLAWLIDRAFGLGQSGVALKDESGSAAALPPPAP